MLIYGWNSLNDKRFIKSLVFNKGGYASLDARTSEIAVYSKVCVSDVTERFTERKSGI